MAEGLVNMSDQFKGLPMEALIGGPLQAVADSSLQLAKAQATYLMAVGMQDGSGGKGGKAAGALKPREVDFSINRPVENEDGTLTQEKIDISVPLLACVTPPSLQISDVDINFDMRVSSSTMTSSKTEKDASVTASAKAGWGPFSASVKVTGSVASTQQSQRKSDNQARYTVNVKAAQTGTPEGLSRVLDIMQSCAVPKQITPADGKKK